MKYIELRKYKRQSKHIYLHHEAIILFSPHKTLSVYDLTPDMETCPP